VFIHPKYKQNSSPVYDFAMVKVSPPFDLSTLGTVTVADSPAEAGTTFYDAGYGVTSSGGSDAGTLRYVDLPLADFAACSATYDGLDSSYQFCAGGVAGKDTCQGDSGGPIWTTSDISASSITDAVQYGVVSFGAGCGTNAGVYTRIDKASVIWQFAESTMAANGGSSGPAGASPASPAGGSAPGSPAGGSPGSPPGGDSPASPAGGSPDSPAGGSPGSPPGGDSPASPAGGSPGSPAGGSPDSPAGGGSPDSPAGGSPDSSSGGSSPDSPSF